MATDTYRYLGPSDALHNAKGDRAAKGETIELTDAEATDLVHRNHRLEMADRRRNMPDEVEEAAEETEEETD